MIDVKLFEHEQQSEPDLKRMKWFMTAVKLFVHIENSQELLILILKDKEIEERYGEIIAKSRELELRQTVRDKLKAFEDSLTTQEKSLMVNMNRGI